MKHYHSGWLTDEINAGKKLKFIFFWSHIGGHNNRIGKFCFSQWYRALFSVNGIEYKTAEHWMMAQKAMLFGDHAIFERIVKSNKPGEAKELGRQVRNYDEQIWNARRFDIVKEGNVHKFSQNQPLADFLMATGERILVEASPQDIIWGAGMSEQDPDIENPLAWPGENLLGFALMEVRDILNRDGGYPVFRS